MSSEQDHPARKPKRDHGPQGTQVFSREEVGRLVEQAESAPDSDDVARLKGISAGVDGQIFALEGDRLVIGRADSCGICLKDNSVSSEHARLSHDSGGWRVVNLLSTNGTFVNNKKVSSAPLRNGDRLRLGRLEFVFVAAGQDAHSVDAADDELPGWLPWAAGAVAVGLLAGLLAWLL